MDVNKAKLLFLLSLFTLLQACNSTGVGTPDDQRIAINPNHPSMVVLGKRHVTHNATEFDFVSCVKDYLTDNNPALNVIPEQQFIDDMYPFFETSTAPLHINSFQRLAQNPIVSDKLDQLNLRYLVWVFGDTDTVDQSGAMSCAVGLGGGGCFGFTTWDDEAQYDAQVWDVDKLVHTGSASAQHSGTSHMPAVVIPIPILAGVQNAACNILAIRIEQHIVL